MSLDQVPSRGNHNAADRIKRMAELLDVSPDCLIYFVHCRDSVPNNFESSETSRSA
jgi:hypothetical protein